MKYRQGRVLEALHSVQVFLDKHGEALGAVNQSGARKNVDAVAAELQAHAVQQDGGRRKAIGETSHQRELRLELRFTMRPIAAVAAARLREVTNFAALRLPSYRLRGMAMVAAAHSMADTASGFTEVFLEAGLPADFIEQLRQAADALSASYDQRRDGQTERSTGTRGLVDAERRARHALRILDTLVVPALKHDEALLRGWRSARMVQAKPGGRPPETESTTGDGSPVVPPATPVPLLSAAPAPSPEPPAAGDEDRDKRDAA